ncbi:MAG: (d)CMP kinase [candidate division Zixibacteria bacterium]|nr:(d)CMP kinase [candidate division Zixibacteria bacterium]NIR67827.1 (d)CMP kinase [candidate division Zixibacteria bacterium]NIS15527.1 (d)CMP kinase [candidate division Zixibacteria bacterium]NIS49052.1 (d)CMP kinase [candidate division Zixibacteria bacterium]NIT52046.1 (d)CMP kinase [candidate division Zixibacteria bacterium]
MSSSTKIIAIDGPAGSGKSTTARLVAKKLGFIFLDTGAMYRAVTLLALEKKVPLSDADALEDVAASVQIDFKDDEEGQKVFANGRDISSEIRSPEVTAAVSEVSAHAGVRRHMVAKQREIGKKYDIVAEGRDTTSVVFPNATLKIYLLASIEERARRRVIDFQRMGKVTTVQEQIKAIQARDEYDSDRQNSPLKQTSDSIPVDTTHLTIEDQVNEIINLFREKTGA